MSGNTSITRNTDFEAAVDSLATKIEARGLNFCNKGKLDDILRDLDKKLLGSMGKMSRDRRFELAIERRIRITKACRDVIPGRHVIGFADLALHLHRAAAQGLCSNTEAALEMAGALLVTAETIYRDCA